MCRRPAIAVITTAAAAITTIATIGWPASRLVGHMFTGADTAVGLRVDAVAAEPWHASAALLLCKSFLLQSLLAVAAVAVVVAIAANSGHSQLPSISAVARSADLPLGLLAVTTAAAAARVDSKGAAWFAGLSGPATSIAVSIAVAVGPAAAPITGPPTAAPPTTDTASSTRSGTAFARTVIEGLFTPKGSFLSTAELAARTP